MNSRVRRGLQSKKKKEIPQHLTTSCTFYHGGPKIPVSDSGKAVRFVSFSGLYLSRVDGCMCKQMTACDFVATELGVGDVFVELKGSDVDHAVDQVDTTLREWRQNGWSGNVSAGLVVCSRYPRHDTKIQRMRIRFAKQYGAALHVVRYGQELDFSRVLAMDGPR